MIKIKDLLKEGESETVEFKPSLSQMDKELLDMVGTGRGIHYILRMKRTISGRLTDD